MPECAANCTFKSKQFCDRHFNINNEYKITITQHWHKNCLGLPGGAVWEGAIVMCEYIVNKYKNKIKGAKILELGSGPGIVGILCAKLGASLVVITDHNEKVLDLVRRNVKQNDVEHNVKVENLEWGTLSSDKYDFIIGSEITYANDHWDPLSKTIASAANSNCKVILSEALRFLDENVPEPGAEQFFEFLEPKGTKEFPFKLIKPKGLEPIPNDVTPYAMDRWAADGIVIWEMIRKKSKLRLSNIFSNK